jgi:hypothetical protein
MHATGDKKSKDTEKGQERMERLRADKCPERTKSES